MSLSEQDIRGNISFVEDRLDNQVINAMLIQARLTAALGTIPRDLNKANGLAHQAWFDFVNDLNKKP